MHAPCMESTYECMAYKKKLGTSTDSFHALILQLERRFATSAAGNFNYRDALQETPSTLHNSEDISDRNRR
jgi:hypothetical protein